MFSHRTCQHQGIWKARKHGEPIAWRGGLQWTEAARMQASRFEHAAMELYSAYFGASMRADVQGHKNLLLAQR